MLQLTDDLTLADKDGRPIAYGTKVYCSRRGYLGQFIRVGPERGDMGVIVVWFDDPDDDDLPDGKLRAACLMDNVWTLDPQPCKEAVERMDMDKLTGGGLGFGGVPSSADATRQLCQFLMKRLTSTNLQRLPQEVYDLANNALRNQNSMMLMLAEETIKAWDELWSNLEAQEAPL